MQPINLIDTGQDLSVGLLDIKKITDVARELYGFSHGRP